MTLLLVLVASYLAGSIPTGVLLGRLRGIDPRAHGSGNIGATNVARTLGKGLGVLTLVIDRAKGAGPVLVTRALDMPAEWVAAAGGGAFLGHVFPVWPRFQRGERVATTPRPFPSLA